MNVRVRAARQSKDVSLGSWIAVLLGAILLSPLHTAQAQDVPPLIVDLRALSLEELANLEVVTVSRRSEPLGTAPAAIYVITGEDIRRSGATTLPEALRLAPNLQVARRDSVQYAISARGFNNTIGNKLLVLIDGRSVYTPLFSGVFWDAQDLLLDEIERIEVISGPGATLWGANAVNGVLNVITRDSSTTPGVRVSGDAGTDERGSSFQFGGRIGSATYRVYGKIRDWSNTSRTDGVDIRDNWLRGQAGFRTDWTGIDQTLTVQADTYKAQSEPRGVIGAVELPKVDLSGGNVLARWTGQLGDGSQLHVQTYWSRSRRIELNIQPRVDIFDIEFQHSLSLGTHAFLWGGGVRHARDEVAGSTNVIFLPTQGRLNWENVFFQGDIPLSAQVNVTAGIKLEWNDYTGLEYLPNARLSWQPSGGHLLWTSVARAVRAPSRFDRDFFVPAAPPFLSAGGPNFVSEVSNVYEVGYRARPLASISYSVTSFHHDWDHLRSGTSLPLPLFLANNIEGEVYGFEAWADWQVASMWRLTAGTTVMDKELRFKPGTSDLAGIDNPTLHNDPDYQWMLRSRLDLPANLELDFHLRGVGPLTVEPVPGYTELDTRLAWLPADDVELSITGRNLLHNSHAEFGALPGRSEIGRSAIFGLKWSR
jgi:iron complex outermembrane receptor protein